MTEKTARIASLSGSVRSDDARQDETRPDVAALVVEARRNPAAFDQLYLLFVQPVFRYLYSRLGNRSDAEDATAETFLAALSGFERYQHRGYFAAWLFSIARFKALDIFRGQRNHVPIDATDDVPVETDLLQDVIHSERKADLDHLIATLPEKELDLLRLRYTAELSFSEISRLLGRSEAAVKKAFYRLLGRLQSQLEESHD